MLNKKILLAIFYLYPFLSYSQNKSLTCVDLKIGVFHSYPINSNEHFLNRRDGEFQFETNLKNGDSTIWKINWIDDCSYTLKYISGGEKLSEEVLKILKKHKLAYEITKVTNDYYVFKGYIDNTSNNPIQTDTMWLSEKTVIVNNELFKSIPDIATLNKEHFRDTSKYALLYVYRSGKISNSIENYLVYFNDNVMCVLKNKTGYIFKILKEGQFNISSRLYKDESTAKIDIKFGRTYFVKSMIHWDITNRLYNFKLEMAIVNPEIGKDEFDKVNIQ